MGKIFRNSWTRNGRRHYSRSWYARINGREENLGTDKKAAEAKYLELYRVAQCGYDPTAVVRAKARSIHELVAEFVEHQNKRAVTVAHVENQLSKLTKVFEGTATRTLADVSIPTINAWLLMRQKSGGCSARTRENFIECLKAFGSYLEKIAKVVIRSPFAELTKKGILAADNPVRPRDAFTEAEVQTLLAYVRRSHNVLLDMDGERRAFCYEVALATGLRRNELGSLTPAALYLAENPPFVVVRSCNTKNKRRAELPLPADLAVRLLLWVSGMPVDAVLFPITGRETSEMIAVDCKRAGIPIARNGRFLDFHSLRTTFGTTLGQRGVPLVVTQKLMRHSTPVLTSNLYSQFSIAELAKAVEKLPNMGGEPGQSSGGQA